MQAERLPERATAEEQELHAGIMKRVDVGLLSLQLNKEQVFQVQLLCRMHANISLSPLHSMLQLWQRKGEPLPYATPGSVTARLPPLAQIPFWVFFFFHTAHVLDQGSGPGFSFASQD